ncbi:hypothetical protein O3P69_005189 [Scylla paramamosain]|uniref:Uncharacterized protein n=1 Tax=Scylla paramamosain TaxID=85552 RepID=A0AAW0UAB5_SCYPA
MGEPRAALVRGEKWRELARIGEKWREVARSGENWREVARSGENWREETVERREIDVTMLTAGDRARKTCVKLPAGLAVAVTMEEDRAKPPHPSPLTNTQRYHKVLIHLLSSSPSPSLVL